MDRFRSRNIFCLLVIAGLTACGSRSQLLGPAAEGSGGGGTGGTGGTGGAATTTTTTSTTSTTTTSTGGGGTGGAPMGPCAELTYATPFSDLDGGLQSHQRSPALAYSNDQKMRVTLASAWQDPGGGPNAPLDLRHTSFDPWVDFPAGSGFGPTYLAAFDSGISFAIAQSPADRFALLMRDFNEPPPGGLRFSAGFEPKSGSTPMSFVADPTADVALFLSYGGAQWLYGAMDVQNNGNSFQTNLAVLNEGFVEAEYPIACTTNRASADAVPVDGGFLAAVSANSMAPSSCDFGVPVPSSGPIVMRFQGPDMAWMTDFAQPSVREVKMASRADGAWILWVHPGGEDLPPKLIITAIDLFATVTVNPFEWEMPCEPGSLAATSFEGFLAVSCIQIDAAGASPHVQVFDPGGVPRGEIRVEATGQAQGRVSLIGSPISRSAVLAWSETAGIGDQIRITRVDCLDED